MCSITSIHCVTISIIDITIGFNLSQYDIDETGGAVTLTVMVMAVKALSRQIEVNLTIHDATATSTFPEDYITPNLPITLMFNGSNLTQEIAINIIDDNITEYAENFTCILSSFDPDVILAPDRANVQIMDNDGEVDTF